MKTRISFIVIVVLIACLFSVAAGQVPQMMNYQGVLTDSLGNQLNGNYNMTFSIYDTSDGGNPLWTQTQYEVSVEKGVFNVLLEIPDSVWRSPEPELIPRRYLGVSISAQPEMNPRRQIGSVPYAYLAGADGDWWYPTMPWVMDPIVYLKGDWGIVRNSSCSVFGNIATHTNLGVSSTTGTSGQNYGYCTVGGGYHNTASNAYASIGGGESNEASALYATVAGGFDNTASWSNATVGGGGGNRASLGGATVGGGSANIASGQNATVAGGGDNTASGSYATVPGGNYNAAVGEYSFAAGRRAKANHSGTFVWADNTDADFSSTGNNQFLIRASKVGIGTSSPVAKLHIAGTASEDGMLLGNNFRMREYSGNFGPNTFETYFNPLSDTSRLVLFGSGGSTMDLIVADGRLGIGTTSPHSTLQINGSVAKAFKHTSVNYYTLTASDCILTASGIAGVQLPSAVGIAGRVYTIKNLDSINSVTVYATSSQTIDGSATYVLTTQWQFVTVVSNGANWLIIGK